MKTQPSHLAVIAAAGLLLVAIVVQTSTSYPASPVQQTFRYNVEYKCGGETVVIAHCRKDSDLPGSVPTRPEEDYCQAYYPDRPKRNGFTAMAVELRGDLIKKLQACGALAANEPQNQPTASTGEPSLRVVPRRRLDRPRATVRRLTWPRDISISRPKTVPRPSRRISRQSI